VLKVKENNTSSISGNESPGRRGLGQKKMTTGVEMNNYLSIQKDPEKKLSDTSPATRRQESVDLKKVFGKGPYVQLQWDGQLKHPVAEEEKKVESESDSGDSYLRKKEEQMPIKNKTSPVKDHLLIFKKEPSRDRRPKSPNTPSRKAQTNDDFGTDKRQQSHVVVSST
jgi:hypothetical protein